ncbi:acylneuraminate cytidylyltransferase family protein [Phycicoccus sp. CSK15P-2]|uniref:acylneuraminate cytidylyltransferase family protein n=1 Tax=Phycicoccus sp. CSK15P-2 TaxID=2807627 RepID=UPI0019501CC7|nr:acylneuraminate cytidylyltransferase family protein [Phycicoccus sp. CSK15P-2]MBM6404314.1 acylneuraminate cytidylyltransferase family protein [Phycicoccus sp. CSK15P-2]
MRILCVVPARGGSKGVPRKNLRPVAGRPLIAWTVEQALAARPAMDVVVSTDDDDIAAAARQAGALVPFLRPAELARDDTPTEPVVRHAVEAARAADAAPDAVMLLQATSPVRLPGTVSRAIAQLDATGADSLVGVVPQAPFLWADDGSGPTAAYDVTARPRRQDLTPQTLRYRETGSLYLTRTWVYDELDNRIGGRVGLFVMDEVEGVDVDTEHDLAVAEQQLLALTPLEDPA